MSNTYYVYASFTNYCDGSSVVIKSSGFTYVGQGGVNPAVAGSGPAYGANPTNHTK